MSSSKQVELGKLYFEEGLPGFADLQFFQLIQEEPESPFFLLQSLENEQVGFWVIDPFVFFQTYEFTLPEQAKEMLRIKETTQLTVLSIVTLRPDGQVTVNLKAPIVINRENRMAKQVILNEETYNIRQPLFHIQEKAAIE